jgi:hypothetical protein
MQGWAQGVSLYCWRECRELRVRILAPESLSIAKPRPTTIDFAIAEVGPVKLGKVATDRGR